MKKKKSVAKVSIKKTFGPDAAGRTATLKATKKMKTR